MTIDEKLDYIISLLEPHKQQTYPLNEIHKELARRRSPFDDITTPAEHPCREK